MIDLRQSTASQVIPLGPFVDSTDGNTEETGLTVANTDIKLWKAGATTLANKNSGGATHISNGIYYCTLDATDTNTLGPLIVYVHESGALYNKQECRVLPAWEYDRLYGAWASNVIYGNAQAVTDGQNLRLPSGSVVADDALNGSILWVVNGTGDEQSPQYIVDSVASDDSVVLSPGFGTAPDTSSDLLVIPAPPNPTSETPNVTANTISASALADVKTQVATALTDIGLDHLLSTSVAGTDVTNNSIFARLVSKSATADWDDYDNTTDSLQATQDDVTTVLTNIAALNDIAVADIFQYAVEDTTQFQELLRAFTAVLINKVSGMGSNAPVFRSLADDKNRVTAVTDSNGNRTAVTLDLT